MAEHSEVAHARVLVDAGRPEAALRRLSTLLASEPDRADALLLFASTQLHHGDAEEAIQAGYRLLSLEPRHVAALRVVARAHSKLGEHDEAKVTAQLAVEEAPQSANAHMTRVVVGIAAGDVGVEVKESATTAVALAPLSSSAHLTLGNYLRKAKLPDKARAAYREALRLDPQSITAQNNLALLGLDARRAVRTVPVFSQMLRGAPNYTLLQRNLVATILAAVRNLRLFLSLSTLLRALVGLFVFALSTGEGTDGPTIPTEVYFIISAAGACLALGLIVGYGVAFLRAGGPGTRAFVLNALHDRRGFRSVVVFLAVQSVVVVASAFIGPQIELYYVQFFLFFGIATLQHRAEKRWLASAQGATDR
ncbi:MAG: hypothetical protein JWP75_1934 [Frondihabitans sp.]|nr:hypothetical protein [Frondihabitans sp.]